MHACNRRNITIQNLKTVRAAVIHHEVGRVASLGLPRVRYTISFSNGLQVLFKSELSPRIRQ